MEATVGELSSELSPVLRTCDRHHLQNHYNISTCAHLVGSSQRPMPFSCEYQAKDLPIVTTKQPHDAELLQSA